MLHSTSPLPNSPVHFTVAVLLWMILRMPSLLFIVPTGAEDCFWSSALLHAGHKISRSHACPGSLKTTAPHQDIHDVIRCWIKNNPVKMENIGQGSPARRLLAKESRWVRPLARFPGKKVMPDYPAYKPTLSGILIRSLPQAKSSLWDISKIRQPIGVPERRPFPEQGANEKGTKGK